MSTMKKWGIMSWLLTIIVSLIVVFSAFSGLGNTEILMRICELSWADTGVFTAAYAFKERTENKRKIACGMIREMAEKYGIENVAPLAQTIISD